jgi:hypothetical protein
VGLGKGTFAVKRLVFVLVAAVLGGCAGQGADLPAPETVVLNGREYQVRFIPEGGMAFTARPTGEIGPDGVPVIEEGNFRADAFRVAGTDDIFEAAGVYLKFCRGINEVPEIWRDEPVFRNPETGEWSFEYPDDCAAWRARAG